MSRSVSPVDEQLARQASEEGHPTTPRQIERWREKGLLPPNERVFPGRGSSATAAAGTMELVRWLSQNARRGRRPADLALLALAEGLPVPEATVRGAFVAAIRRPVLLVERDFPEGAEPEDIAEAAADAGLAATVLPERVRRIDQSLETLGADWALPGLGDLDPGPTSDPLTPKDWAYNAVLALLKGGGDLTIEQMAQMARSVLPKNAVVPVAADMERNWPDNEADRELLLNESGGLSFIPEGDLRQLFEEYALNRPLEELRNALETATQVAEWAERLCADTEAEVASNTPGPAAQEWMIGSLVGPARLMLTTGLRDADSSPSDLAFTAVLLLFMQDLLGRVRSLVPAANFDVLALPGVLPQCILTTLNFGVSSSST
ncbi:hypothetical protein ACFVWG_20765 [Kribbella sp. NPDC058245]|uniref:hypothetical protein n=1 Tax=Kribbella sp. NPDC058245 TaxID=3346399 RepID=UPI0036EA4CA1